MQQAYYRHLLKELQVIVCALTAEAMGGGRDSNFTRIKGLDERLASIPSKLEDIARWAKQNNPARTQ
jgi:hypothetical protein